MLPFSLCNEKRLAIRHMNRPLFPTTLSIPSHDIGKVGLKTYQHPLVQALGGGKLEGKAQLRRPRRKERIILKLIFKRWDGTWTGLIWLRLWTGGSLL